MSASVLALAVRDVILANVQINGENIDRNTCDLTFDAQPKPTAPGQLFIAVHLGGWTDDGGGDYELREMYSVNVTPSLKIGDVPSDEYGPQAWALLNDGLDAVCRKLIRLIHQNQVIRLVCNGAMAPNGQSGPPAEYALTGTGFTTTTQFTGAQAPVPRRAAWFNGGMPLGVDNENALALAGVSQTLTFGKVLRSQAIAGQT